MDQVIKAEPSQSATPATPAKGIQVTDDALKKIRSAMVEEDIFRPELRRPAFRSAGRRMFRTELTTYRFDTQPRNSDQHVSVRRYPGLRGSRILHLLHGMTLDSRKRLCSRVLFFVDPELDEVLRLWQLVLVSGLVARDDVGERGSSPVHTTMWSEGGQAHSP